MSNRLFAIPISSLIVFSITTFGCDAPSDDDSSDTGTDTDTETTPSDSHWAIIMPDPEAEEGGSLLVARNQSFGCDEWSEYETCILEYVTFKIQVRLAPEDVAPGLYNLGSVVNSYSSATGTPNADTDDCWESGGHFGPGFLEILDIDETQMLFKFRGTSTQDFVVNEIVIQAVICP